MPQRQVRSAAEQQLLDKAQRYLPGGTLGNTRFSDDVAFVVKAGKGSKVYDMSGNEYIDFLLGSGPMILGHAHPAVVAAVRDYLERGSTYFTLNEPAISLAEAICEAVPCAEKIRFCSTGSEATFFALRAARTFTKKDKILKFEGGYHGNHDYALMSSSPSIPKDFPRAAPDSAGIPRVLEGEVLIAPFNDLETTSAIIERHHHELGGVIVEPFQRIITPRPGFLQGLREVTQRFAVPLLFDEVVTGFRLAWGGAQEYYGVVPDLAAYGKIIGGGYPLSAVVGRADLMEAFNPDREASGDFIAQTGTLNGNPVAAVAGLATLQQLKTEGTYRRLFATGHTLRQGLVELLQHYGIPGQVVGEDPLFDVVFTDEPVNDYRGVLTQNRDLLRRFNSELLTRGVLKGSSKMYISLAHTAADVEQTLTVVREAFEVMTKA
ncbi:MAG: aspartate aminotransferase family protein [Candidatus Tectomicrobia bacterium]|nr:aspartate aminotransferase family protein [Candidatus Tectomicrobia bacterium]